MSTDHASSLCPKLEGDFDYSEEIDADEESLPTKSIAYQQHNKLQGDDTHPIFLVRKPSQKRFSDFRSTSQGKVSSVSKSLGKTNSLRSSSSLQRKGTLRNVVFADEPNGRRKKAITHIQNLQKEYEQTKHENTKRKVFSRPSTVREEKSGPLTFDSLLGEAHLPESDVPRSSWVSFDRNPLKSLFTSRKKKMEGLIQNGVSTDKLVPVEEPVAVVDKRLSGIINDKAGLLHIQRSFSLQRYSSINGNNNPKLRNILKKHSIKKASFEIQALLRKLKTHHNKPTVLKIMYRTNKKFKRILAKVKNRLKSLRHPITPSNPIKLILNFILMLLMAYELIIIPMKVAFSWGNSEVFDQIEWVEIFFFILDILLNFHTIFIIDSVPVVSHTLIALHYLKGLFWIDALACFPFQYILKDRGNSYSNFWALLHLIKVFKIFRLLKEFKLRKQWASIREYLGLTADVNVSVEVNGTLRLVKLMMLLTMLMHWMACSWYLIGNSQGVESWINIAGIEDRSWSDVYIAALYWASTTMMTVGYGDMYAANSTERVFNIVSMLLGCGIFGYSLNQIGDIINQINAEVNYKDMRMDQLTKFLNKNEVDPNFQRKIKQYMEFKLDHERTLRESDQVILDSISGSLKTELLRQINGKVLKNNILFNKSFGSHFLLNLSMSLDEKVLAPDEFIFREGESQPPSIFFIIRGKIALYLERYSVPLKTLEKGDHMGELSFFTSIPRESTAKTMTFCSLFYITKEKFLQLIDDHQFDKEVFHMVKDKVNLYRDYRSIGAACLICGSPTHLHLDCVMAHLVGEKEDVIKKYQASNKDFANDFQRKPRRRFNALIDLKETQLRTKQYRITESLKSHPVTQVDLSCSEKATRKDKKHMTVRVYHPDDNAHLDTVNIPSKPESTSFDFSNSDFLELGDNGNKLDVPRSPKIFSDNKDFKNKITKASTTLQALFTGDLAQRQRYRKVLLENRGLSEDGFESTEVWEEPVIDQVKNFQIYFPHNNLTKILEQREYFKIHKNRKYLGVRLDTDQEIVQFKKKLGKIFEQTKRMSVQLGATEIKRKRSLFSKSVTPEKKLAMRAKTLA